MSRPLLILIAGPHRSGTGDAVLRLPGESTGADQDVAIAQERGLPVNTRVEDMPGYRAS